MQFEIIESINVSILLWLNHYSTKYTYVIDSNIYIVQIKIYHVVKYAQKAEWMGSMLME